MLHLLRHVDLEHGQHVEDGVLHADAQSQTGLLHGRVCALDAAAAVEAVEGAGEVDDEAVDAAGVVLLGGHDDLLREGSQHPDQVHLAGLGEQGSVHLLGTGKLHDDKLVEIIRENFDLRPAGIIKMLDLRRPIYRQTAAYGHFGRTDLNLPWEKLDKVDVLAKYLG